MSARTMAAALCLAAILLAAGEAAMADDFGVGANQFTIDFVTISGDSGNLGSWPAGPQYSFTGVNHDDYRMGICEITNDHWNKFKASLAPVTVTGTPAFAYDDSPLYTGASVPANSISWYEAAQFVNWLNTSTGHQAAYKFTGTQGTSDYALAAWSAEETDGTNLYRNKKAYYFLPTEDEWVKAAYWNGTSLQTYSNASAADLVSGSPDPAKWNYSPSAGSEPWNVGSGSEELNGTYDMMGNVLEWLESPYSDTSADSGRALRGGNFYGDDYTLASSRRWYGSLGYDGFDVGFRVASVPEPASPGLMAVAGLGLLRRRRRRETANLK